MTLSLFPRPIIDATGAIQSDWKAVIEQGAIIGDDGGAVNQTLDLYTVPSGKVAYIISVQVNILNSNTGAEPSGIIVIAGRNVMRVQVDDVDGAQANQGLNFSIPFKLKVGEKVQVISNAASCEVWGSFAGYEINK